MNFFIISQSLYRSPITHEARGGGCGGELVWDAMDAPARSSSASAAPTLLILSFLESGMAV